MLYSLTGTAVREIRSVPHKRDYDIWRTRLLDNEYRAIEEELEQRINGTEIQTSSWIPGRDWSGTVFQPIYEKACLQDEDASAKFFGLILWRVMMDHDDCWAFGRYEKDGLPIEGLTYFRISPNNS